ncbi:MAG TPA: hypothetical protein GXZ38_05795, partial [Spirochaetales bacterium]|nr:hypothetical protein [Spirochaetales bacterium]
TPEEKDKVLDLISDALGVLEIIETISPTNAIGLNELLGAFGIKGISRDGGGSGSDWIMVEIEKALNGSV